MNIQTFVVLSAISLLLVGCGANTQGGTIGEIPSIEGTSFPYPSPQSSSGLSSWLDPTEREDTQGAVTVIIKPINLDQPGETIDFEVVLDTHSVDLSMDLAALSTLSTDTGLSVDASSWSGEPGGHHVQGTLSFPLLVNNVSLLGESSSLTLVIRDLAAAERSFTWSR